MTNNFEQQTIRKMDNLEQFIRDNREEFDTAVPSLKIWAELDKQLPKAPEKPIAKRISIQRFLSIAAAVTLLIGFGIGIGFHLSPNPDSATITLSDLSPEYAEVEQYYAAQVNNKLARLANYQATNPDLQADLVELDQWMQNLQQELSIVPKSKEEAVVNDIINLYKTKVAILEKLLDSIQSSNQKNSIQHETVDI